MQCILFNKKKEQTKMSILCAIRAIVTRTTNLFLIEVILKGSQYFELYHWTLTVVFCLFVSNFKSMFKRYVHSKSLFFIIFIFLVTKDVIKTVCVHLLGIFPIFLLRMNVSRYLLNVPIGKINIVQTFKKRKLSKLCFILIFQVVLIATLKSLILLRK